MKPVKFVSDKYFKYKHILSQSLVLLTLFCLFREEEEIQRAVTASLNQEMQRQGHITVVDSTLINPQPIVLAAPDDKKSQRDRKESYKENVEDFPDLAGSVVHKSDSDSDGERDKDRVAHQRDTLAKQIARASNFSVQDGSMDEADFPSLGGGNCAKNIIPSQPSSKGAWYLNAKNDFPSLGSGPNSPRTKPKQPVSSSANSWNVPKPQPVPAAPRQAGRPPPPGSTSDFPSLTSLSSIGNMLMNPSQPSKKQQNYYTPPTVTKEDTKSKDVREYTATVPDWQKSKSHSEESTNSAKQKKSKSKKKESSENKDEDFSSGTNNKQKKSKSKKNDSLENKDEEFSSLYGKPVISRNGTPSTDCRSSDKSRSIPDEYPALEKSKSSEVKVTISQKTPPNPASDEYPALTKPVLSSLKPSEDFPALGKPKGIPVFKGKIVGAIPAGTKWGESDKTAAPIVARESEWTQVPTSGRSGRDVPSSKADVMSEQKEKKKKKKKSPIPDLSCKSKKDEDFPALTSQLKSPPPTPVGSKSTPPAPVGGSTWVSEGVKKTIEKGDEWHEVPVTKAARDMSSKKPIKHRQKVIVNENDFPSLGKPASGKVSAGKWGPNYNSVNEDTKEFKEDSEKGLVKLKSKGKKKGKKEGVVTDSPQLSEDDVMLLGNCDKPADVENSISDKNPVVEAIIQEIAKIESGSNKENASVSVGDVPLNDFPSVHSMPLQTTLPQSVPELTDFPALGQQATAPPPGFPGATRSAAPPGLDGAPPGFQSMIGSNTSKKGNAPPGFSASPRLQDVTNNAAFIKPTHFQSRNQKLICDFQDLLQDDDTKFTLFNKLSGLNSLHVKTGSIEPFLQY